ncbi:PatB family C-S lyase [Limibacter armeniacum]|uniref:MalY/PatB family protein n=1 Tax=Limibacter armeniacum TaxID=466084 RepID=UPI002FE6B6A2
MEYNFDEVISREETDTVKYGLREKLFGSKDVIPMWVADMDFRVPKEVQDALKARVEHPIFGYTIQSERCWESVVNWLERRHNWKVDQKELVFSPGIVPALSLLVHAFTKPEDKVLVFSPVYTPFFEAIKGNGRKVVPHHLQEVEGKYTIDFSVLEEQLSQGVKVMIVCNPHNPSGRMWTKPELQRLVELGKKYDTLIVSDEIHADLVLWGNKHTPMATVSEEAANRVITCMAPSKTFNLAGLNASYLVFKNETLQKQYRSVAGTLHLDFGGTMGTEAMIAAYTYGEEWLEQLLPYLERNISLVVNFIKEHIPEIKPMVPDATYLLWLDCRALGLDDVSLKQFMVEEAGIGLNEGRLFGEGGKGWQRMNLACPKSIVEKAMAQLKVAVEKRRIVSQ